MEEMITFEDMPKAMVQLMAKLEEIETTLEEILYNFRLYSKILLKLLVFSSILEKLLSLWNISSMNEKIETIINLLEN